MESFPLDLLIQVLSMTDRKTSAKMITAVPQLARFYWQEMQEVSVVTCCTDPFCLGVTLVMPTGSVHMYGEFVGWHGDALSICGEVDRDNGYIRLDIVLPGRVSRARYSHARHN